MTRPLHRPSPARLALLLAAVLGSAACATTGAGRGDAALREALDASDSTAIRERWGIEVLGLHPAAAGAMLDFRYRVVDPAKAAPLFDVKARAGLVDLDRDEAIKVATSAKLGAMRPKRAPVAGRGYFMLFDNSARRLGPGSRVAVVVGEFAVRGLRVQ